MDRRAIAVTTVLALAAWPVGGTLAAQPATVAVATPMVPPVPRLSPLDSAQRRKTTVASSVKREDEPAQLDEARTAVVSFTNSAFPYDGLIPRSQTPFLDASDGARRGHTSGRAGVLWEDETYSDRSVLLSFPRHFDLRRPAVIVVFFHGNQATLARDVIARQKVVDQVAGSGLNAILVAPQLAYDAQDSSAGNFWRPGFFASFLSEASAKLAKLYGGRVKAASFQRLPVIVVAYSGGYNPAAYALAEGGATRRVRGVVLLDALYGEQDKFTDWIEHNRKSAFFFSAYSPSSAGGNATEEAALKAHGLATLDSLPPRIGAGAIVFLATDPDIQHEDFVTTAWVASPLQDVLARVQGYPR